MSGPGYSPADLPSGDIIQSGVYSPSTSERLARAAGLGIITRAVVLRTHYPDDDVHKGNLARNTKMVSCDVRTYGKRSTYLYRVPVMQRAAGLFDEDLWVPRPSASAIDGGTLVSDPTVPTDPNDPGGKLTPAESVDGDHVIVAFLDGDVDKPVIIGAWGHPSARRTASKTEGRRRRIRHNGTVIEWDHQGNLTVDATGAALDGLAAKGTETSASGTGGKVTLKTKDGAGGVSTVELDASGGIKLQDAAGDLVRLEKAAQKATVSGGLAVAVTGPTTTVTATTAAKVTSPSITLEGSQAVNVTAPATTVTAATAVQVTSPSITLGAALTARPVVKHTEWAAVWETAGKQLAKASTWSPPSTEAEDTLKKGDVAAMLVALQAVAEAYKLLATVATKAG